MLVMSRHKNEKVIIGHDIELAIVEIRGEKVRIGVQAPSYVPVHREEVYTAIARRAAEVMAKNINATGGDAWTAEKVLLQAKTDPLFLAELQASMNEIVGFHKDGTST